MLKTLKTAVGCRWFVLLLCHACIAVMLYLYLPKDVEIRRSKSSASKSTQRWATFKHLSLYTKYFIWISVDALLSVYANLLLINYTILSRFFKFNQYSKPFCRNSSWNFPTLSDVDNISVVVLLLVMLIGSTASMLWRNGYSLFYRESLHFSTVEVRLVCSSSCCITNETAYLIPKNNQHGSIC